MSQTFDMALFLEQYEEFPCLWRKSSPDFKNRTKRDAAENVLLEFSGLANIKLLRQKIRNIRCTYNQEKTKVKKSMGSGAGVCEKYIPKLSWFTIADSFLGENIQNENTTQSNLDSCENMEEEHSNPSEPEHEIENSLCSPTPISKKAKGVCPKKTKNTKGNESSIDNAVQLLEKIADRTSQANEFTIFGQHIASQLQSLPLEEAVALQGNIQQMITEVRLRCIRNQQTLAGHIEHSIIANNSTNGEDGCTHTHETSSSEVILELPFVNNSYFSNWNV